MPTHKPNLLLFSECSMSGRHGTGVQLMRLFDRPGISYNHFYFHLPYAGFSEVSRSFLLDNPWPTKWKGRRTWGSILGAMSFGWWYNNQINERKLTALMRQHEIQCDLFYAVVSHEEHAERALSLAKTLRRPYVVHLMDIYHDEGIQPDSMPAFRDLLAGAAHILVISDAIGDEVRKIRADNITSIPMGVPSSLKAAEARRAGAPLRIALMGRPYEALNMLVQTAPRLLEQWPDLRFVYIGQHETSLPPGLLPYTDVVGYLSNAADVEQQLASCHLAFLCGPINMGCFGRFSIPSRVADYLMAGLPLLDATGTQTAARRFLASVGSPAVVAIETPDDLIAAITRFTASPEAWHAASKAARAYAESHLHIDIVRARIFSILRTIESPAAISSQAPVYA